MYVHVLGVYRSKTCAVIMSGKYYFIDKHGNGQTLELIKVSQTEYVRKRSPENPANSERAKKPKPAGTNEVNIRKYLENKLKNKSVTAEDTALDDEATSDTAEAPSSPQQSQKSVVEETVNNQHPAPLPVLPIIYFIEPSSKLIAPAPEIKSHLLRDRVALTWFTLEEDLSAYEEMLIFQVYCYKQTSDPPSTANWKKLVELTAHPLPMTCFVGKCNVGKYYFAVRGIDNQLRVGPFSSPVSITFKDGGIMPVTPQFKRVISY